MNIRNNGEMVWLKWNIDNKIIIWINNNNRKKKIIIMKIEIMK